MNKKGFTLVELLATLIVLGIVVGLVVTGLSFDVKKTKEKAEQVFVETIEDALKIYIDSDAKKLTFVSRTSGCIDKSLKSNVKVYMINSQISLGDVIQSTYSPLTLKDMVNPNNEKETCDVEHNIVAIYRDDDYVYYYDVAKDDLGCLTLDLDGSITNLPELKSCS